MPQQVLVVHGGTTFPDYESYLSYLKNYQLESLEKLEGKSWKSRLAEDLGENYQVIKPSFPCRRFAKYNEWKIWLEKFFPFLQPGVILIGHSLGGTFLLKYLAENDFPQPISQLHLVAAAVTEENEPLASFALPADLSSVAKKAEEIFLYQSEDDPVVPFNDALLLAKQLPSAKKIFFAHRQHFNQPEFPEIISKIREK